ncbi:MAG: GFA family protein [Rhizobium sp.]|nr:GFA family protein [Rhizobium sp.]
MEERRTGACLCGGVRFTVEGAVGPVVFCHCSQCRRQSGLHYAATDVPRGRLTVTGEDLISWYRASDEATRGFCSHCGSALFWKRDGGENISVVAGAFDLPSGLAGGYHIYCADKGDFYSIDNGLPQYQASKPS